MKRLLIATHNPAKLREIKHFLRGVKVELLTLSDLEIDDDVEETGETFEENAILKAKYFCQKTGLPVLADDGGIEIDYLNGEPGVHSRRWIHGGDIRATDTELINHILKLLKGVGGGKRGAMLRAVMALVSPTGSVKTAEGKIRGIIAQEPHQKRWSGFPFRSLFYIPEINKFYNPDEMTKEDEEKFNHRRKALEKIKRYLK